MFGAVQLEYSQPDEIDQDLNRPIYSVIFFFTFPRHSILYSVYIHSKQKQHSAQQCKLKHKL